MKIEQRPIITQCKHVSMWYITDVQMLLKLNIIICYHMLDVHHMLDVQIGNTLHIK